MKKCVLLISAIIAIPFFAFPQLVIDNTQTPQQVVQNTLLGSGVSATNITYTGPANSIGVFSGTTNIGIPQGVIITTGDNVVAIGPNTMTSESQGGGTAGDGDLTTIAGNTTYDAAVLEFDFVPSADTIQFDYVFASEEYPEYVCSNYNDVFAFFLTGLNPGGGNYTNQNIAIIPGTTLPVAINSVNPGVAGTYGTGSCISLAYSSFYVDNTGGATIEYDGFTTVFTAMAPVVPCSSYHIKIAIADVGDGAYDSGVFLEAKSFSSPAVNVSAFASTDDSLMVEGCGAGTFVFTRGGSLANSYTIHYQISGTATNGNDYQDLSGNPILDSIVFPAGQDSAWLVINPVNDWIPEGYETIIIMIPQQTSCVADTLMAVIYIKNVDPMNIITLGDTVICPQNGDIATITAIVQGGYGPFTFQWGGGLGDSSIIHVSPPNSTTYSVTVIDSCGSESASNTIEVIALCPISIPNVFTPNNDGSNDYFFIKNIDMYPMSKLLVFNRWGRKVFESNDYKNDWDGGALADGVYFYVLYQSNGDDYHGTVTLMR